MATMLLKAIDSDLLREVNYAAKGEGLTQQQWVVKVLAKAVSKRETDSLVRKSVRQATGAKPDEVKHVPPTPRVETVANSGQGGGVRVGVANATPANKHKVTISLTHQPIRGKDGGSDRAAVAGRGSTPLCGGVR